MRLGAILTIATLSVALPVAAQMHQAVGKDTDEKTRSAARASMEEFVKGQMTSGTYYFYDAVENRLLALRFSSIHADVRENGNFRVACSDFRDQFGRTVDIDFLALSKGPSFTTVQGVIHAIDGHERRYNLSLEKKTH